MLDDALKAVRSLKQADISEVGKYANPPAGVKLVMEAVCTLLVIAPKRSNKGAQHSYRTHLAPTSHSWQK